MSEIMPTMGHNNPPSDAELAIQRFEAQWNARPAKLRLEEVILLAERPVNDADSAARAVDAVKVARKVIDAARLTYSDVVEPFEQATKAVRSRRDAIQDLANSAKGKLERMIASYEAMLREAEQKRHEAEQQRLAAIAEVHGHPAGDQQPEPEAPSKPRTEGNYGAKVFERTSWVPRIDDYEIALAMCSQEPEVREGLEKALRRHARSKDRSPIPGVTFVAEKGVTIR
jgi:hypothetical protein